MTKTVDQGKTSDSSPKTKLTRFQDQAIPSRHWILIPIRDQDCENSVSRCPETKAVTCRLQDKDKAVSVKSSRPLSKYTEDTHLTRGYSDLDIVNLNRGFNKISPFCQWIWIRIWFGEPCLNPVWGMSAYNDYKWFKKDIYSNNCCKQMTFW